ncbi:CHAD domain-containing protein [Arthrobacter sp. MSA 4-2]|uniref:CHAD domain-containing protein n=1 Tax=Arthrobacter sp. MSA 4-2 TaxID=2794349 RepID=UPI0018E86BE6|nr:CHAD domain-containing protein [Arthrobacter sp. MSA 4-2]MBJ2122346.1 CHAD domain-containing protein [Arthrobacter sp. MSA 4-2]
MTQRMEAPAARRYVADTDAVLPDLPGGPGAPPPGGTAVLRRVHWDLDDAELAHAGITVAVTGEGKAARWDVTFPPALSQLDFSVASPETGVPPEVLERVRVHVRDRDLRQVADLVLRRREFTLPGSDGVGLRVRDDVVEPGEPADPGGWREWTVEAYPDPAADGGPAGGGDSDGGDSDGDGNAAGELLDTIEALLVAAGASHGGPAERLARQAEGRAAAPESPADGETPIGAVLATVFSTLAAELKAWDLRVRVDEEDAVHQLRVRSRTLRSVLKTYGELLDEAAARDLEDRLQRLGHALAAARDADVIRGWVAESVKALPDGLIPAHVARRLQRTAAAQYRQAYGELLEELSSPDYFLLLDVLDGFAARPPLAAGPEGRSARKAIRRAVKRQQRKVLELVDGAAGEEDAVARIYLLHGVRKRSKRLRYAIRSVSAATGFDFGSKLDAVLATAEDIQDALGVHRDSITFQEFVAATAREAHRSGANTFAYGVLHQAEAPRQEAAAAAYREAAERLRQG